MAPTPEPPATITLKVKVPLGYLESGDEFQLGDTVPVTTKVGAVRARIQQLIPSHPPPQQQRLLYGGRALVDNEQTLVEALNTKRDPSQTTYVLHLVVKGAGDGTTHRRAGSETNTPARSVTPAQGPNTPAEVPAFAQHTHPHPLPRPMPHPAPRAGTVHLNPLQQQAMAQAMQQQHQMLHQNFQQGMAGHGMTFNPAHLHGPPAHVFGQAVQHDQQQRAAAGMQGVPASEQAVPAQHIHTEVGNGAADLHAASPQPPQHTSQGVEPENQQTQGDGQSQQQRPSRPPDQQQPRRPISGQGFHMEGLGPNGQRFTIEQQTFQLPLQGMLAGGPNQLGQFGLPGMSPFPANFAPAMQHAPTQPAGPSALDRARGNLAEMRRMLEELREQNVGTEYQQSRIRNLQDRTRSLEDYVDPFHLGSTAPAARSDGLHRQAPTQDSAPQMPPPFYPSLRRQHPNPLLGRIGMPPSLGDIPMLGATNPARPSANVNPHDVTCYLLSGRQGPHALLLSPQHGSYLGLVANNATGQNDGSHLQTTLRYRLPNGNAQQNSNGAQALTPTQPLPVGQEAQPGANAQEMVPAAANAGIQQQGQQAQAQDPLAPMQPLLAHFWLLFRILIFAYFLLGANMGWRRPVAMLLIGGGFMMIRAGLFGNGGVLRRWWEGVVRIEENRNRQGQQQQAAGAQGAAAQQNHGQAQGQAAPEDAEQRRANGGGMPTPEQVANRLMREQGEQGAQQRAWWREQIRPVERVLALLFASLWPGVGEAHVRARREADQRQRDEEEVERRRVEEEERKKREEDEAAAAAAAETAPREDGEDAGEVTGKEEVGRAEASGVEHQAGEVRRRASVGVPEHEAEA